MNKTKTFRVKTDLKAGQNPWAQYGQDWANWGRGVGQQNATQGQQVGADWAKRGMDIGRQFAGGWW